MIETSQSTFQQFATIIIVCLCRWGIKFCKPSKLSLNSVHKFLIWIWLQTPVTLHRDRDRCITGSQVSRFTTGHNRQSELMLPSGYLAPIPFFHFSIFCWFTTVGHEIGHPTGWIHKTLCFVHVYINNIPFILKLHFTIM